MKNGFKKYVVVWAVLVALVNVLAFVTPDWLWHEKYAASFWGAYGSALATFLGQLICVACAAAEKNPGEVFCRSSRLRGSYGDLVATFFVGGLCVTAPKLLWWAGVVWGICVLTLNAVSFLQSAATAETVALTDRDTT